jgi:hypothetical protein
MRREPISRGSGPTATSCAWKGVDNRTDINLVANYGAGLELVDEAAPSLEERTPLTVAGYPAVRIDHADSPTCRIAVGVAVGQAFSAQASSLTTDAPPLCDLALSLAEETVAALRAS